jgi:hypothetical protein
VLSTFAFPKRVCVRVLPKPVNGLAVGVYFEMQKKNSFGYVVFLDGNGFTEISGDELLKTFDATRFLFLMDYVDPRNNFTGKITAKVLSNSDLRRAITAFETFRGRVGFPADYEKNLAKAVERGQDPSNYDVEVSSS